MTDGIIKHIIHERHRHQREHNNNRSRGTVWNDREKDASTEIRVEPM